MKKLLAALVFMVSVAAGQSAAPSKSYTSEWFRIKYENRIPSREAKAAGTLLDTTAAAMSARLRVPLRRKFDVQLYSTSDRLKREFRTTMFNDGFYRGNKIYLVVPKPSNGDSSANDAVSRVVTTAILSQVQQCPAWLAEAYSFYAGNALTRFSQPSRPNLLTFHDLSEDFARAEGAEDRKEINAKLAATMSFLVERYGESKVEKVFAEFKDDASVEQVFESTFGEKISTIEQEWVRALAPQRK